MKAKKPAELVVGRAYRMWRPFRSGPSDQVAVVTDVRQVTSRTRTVSVEWLFAGPGSNTTNYSDFMDRVFSEEQVQ